MDLELAGRVVLVVGGAGFIGRAVVERLRGEGAMAVVASRSSDTGVTLDATDDASIAVAVDSVVAEHGRLDGLVVTAAPPAQTLTRTGDPDVVQQAVADKAIAFLRAATHVLPVMEAAGYGRVVGISGQNALLTGNIAGSVRNAALIVAAQNLADEFAGSGVTVNVVNPGPVRSTPAAEVAVGSPGQSSPEQVADLVVFLLSPRAGAISGESIAVGHRVRGVTSL